MVMRINGFSGVDIDSIVKELMAARRSPLNKLNQQKVKLEWQREQYRDINIKLVDFRNNKLFNYGLSNAISAKQATVSGETGAVSARTTASAKSGTITVEVSRLATAATAISTTSTGATASSKLKDDMNFTAEDGLITVEINGKSISVADTATVSDLVSKINSSDAGVSAYFEAGQLSLTSKTTGTAAFSLSTDFKNKFNLSATAGETAEVKINGITTSRDSNTFTVNGVEITLNDLTQSGKKSTITVSADVDKTMDTIKSFITDYNNILDALNSKVNEERFRKFSPLTDEQKKEMKDSEIEMWEEKARSGLLRRDSTLTTLSNNLRMALYTDVKIGDTLVNLSQFGIETGNWEQRGKLVIKDEAKLRAAIEADPDKVVALFTQRTTSNDPRVKNSAANPDSGLFNRLSNALMSAVEELSKRVGTSRVSTDAATGFSPDSMMGESIRQLDRRIADMNQRMIRIETNFYKQFAAMEAAMNRYGAQSSALFGASM